MTGQSTSAQKRSGRHGPTSGLLRAAAPRSSFAIEDPQVVWLGADGAVIVYGVVAERDGAAYSALVSSAYARRGGAWRLALHQQTPR